MRIALALFVVVVAAAASPAMAQVDLGRAAQSFTEAQALCGREGESLWRVSFCMPMVFGNARVQPFSTRPAAGQMPLSKGRSVF